jgi:ribonuclease BN (tRNA processing enzyme)
MLCEASIEGERGDHHFVHHLTATEAGQIAQEAEVETLILTHLPPSLDKAQSVAMAREVFEGTVELASPGDVFEV